MLNEICNIYLQNIIVIFFIFVIEIRFIKKNSLLQAVLKKSYYNFLLLPFNLYNFFSVILLRCYKLKPLNCVRKLKYIQKLYWIKEGDFVTSFFFKLIEDLRGKGQKHLLKS